MAIEEQTLPGEKKTIEVVGGGSIGMAIGGAAAVVLAIIGLARVYPHITLAIATIAVGVALLFEGAAVAAEYRRLVAATTRDENLGGAMTAEFFGGAVGVVLGILDLVGVAPMVLCAVAAIVFGGSLFVGTSAPEELTRLGGRGSELAEAAHTAGKAAGGTQLLVGVAAIVLGILALVGVSPRDVLTLVALLGLGFSVLLSGSAVGTKMMSAFAQ